MLPWVRDFKVIASYRMAMFMSREAKSHHGILNDESEVLKALATVGKPHDEALEESRSSTKSAGQLMGAAVLISAPPRPTSNCSSLQRLAG